MRVFGLLSFQVNLVDRCLTKFKINRKQFQLLGCACMMIAAKFEEVYGPNVEEFVYISDQTYTAEEVRVKSVCG